MAVEIEALEKLYRDRYGQFVRASAAITGDVESARDAVQSGFARAVRHRRSFRGSGSLDAWVWQIVINEAHRSTCADRVVYEPPVAAATANGHAAGLDVGELIARLPVRQRAAIFLRYYADLEYAKIADLLGIEVGTVSATLNAAHRSLRRDLEEVER